jgi:uncharacterized repeat protein (TIGR03987 family)
MPEALLNATILFSIALVLYTIAIWSERLSLQLKNWHVLVFFAGVVTDFIATWITIKFIGAIVFTPHALFGFAALILMVLHFIWALMVRVNNSQKMATLFHKFGLFVWSVWMISYITGFTLGINKLF